MWTVIGSDGQEYGPVNDSTLREWAAQGRVTPDTQLVDSSGIRVPASSLAGLFGPAAPPNMAAYPRSSGLPAKSKLAAILLALFLGTLGIHRFYLGHVATGVAMLVGTLVLWPFTCGISAAVVAVWGVVDAILIATGGLGDKDGAALL